MSRFCTYSWRGQWEARRFPFSLEFRGVAEIYPLVLSRFRFSFGNVSQSSAGRLR